MTDDVEREQESGDSGQSPDPESVSEQPAPDELMPDEPASDEQAPDEPAPDEVSSDEPAPDEPDVETASDDTPDDSSASLDERVPKIEVDSGAEVAEPDVEDAEVAPSDTGLPDVAAAPDSPKVPWWPFLILLAAWLGVVTGSFFTLSYESTAVPLIQQESYPYVILAGLVLAILGPIVSLTVWFVMWLRAGKGHREGLMTVSLVRGAGVTLLGVLAWWGAIVALDALRLGLVG